MSEQTAEQKVKAVYPDAYAACGIDQPLWMICRPTSGNMLGFSKHSAHDAWESALARLPATPPSQPEELRCKAEGIKNNAFVPPSDPPPLKTDKKFTLWLDDEGDYVLQDQQVEGLVSHGSTPDDAVWAMRIVQQMASQIVSAARPSQPEERPIGDPPVAPATPDPTECAATGTGHQFESLGPKGEAQCRFCGEPPTPEPAPQPEWVALHDAPVGLFLSQAGHYGFKSEYHTNNQTDAYVVESGEYFWGGANDAKSRELLLVKPITHLSSISEPASAEEGFEAWWAENINYVYTYYRDASLLRVKSITAQAFAAGQASMRGKE